jgi:hypothetical protein
MEDFELSEWAKAHGLSVGRILYSLVCARCGKLGPQHDSEAMAGLAAFFNGWNNTTQGWWCPACCAGVVVVVPAG